MHELELIQLVLAETRREYVVYTIDHGLGSHSVPKADCPTREVVEFVVRATLKALGTGVLPDGTLSGADRANMREPVLSAEQEFLNLDQPLEVEQSLMKSIAFGPSPLIDIEAATKKWREGMQTVVRAPPNAPPNLTVKQPEWQPPGGLKRPASGKRKRKK